MDSWLLRPPGATPAGPRQRRRRRRTARLRATLQAQLSSSEVLLSRVAFRPPMSAPGPMTLSAQASEPADWDPGRGRQEYNFQGQCKFPTCEAKIFRPTTRVGCWLLVVRDSEGRAAPRHRPSALREPQAGRSPGMTVATASEKPMTSIS